MTTDEDRGHGETQAGQLHRQRARAFVDGCDADDVIALFIDLENADAKLAQVRSSSEARIRELERVIRRARPYLIDHIAEHSQDEDIGDRLALNEIDALLSPCAEGRKESANAARTSHPIPPSWSVRYLEDGTPIAYHCPTMDHRSAITEHGRMTTCGCGARWTIPDGWKDPNESERKGKE